MLCCVLWWELTTAQWCSSCVIVKPCVVRWWELTTAQWCSSCVIVKPCVVLCAVMRANYSPMMLLRCDCKTLCCAVMRANYSPMMLLVCDCKTLCCAVMRANYSPMMLLMCDCKTVLCCVLCLEDDDSAQRAGGDSERRPAPCVEGSAWGHEAAEVRGASESHRWVNPPPPSALALPKMHSILGKGRTFMVPVLKCSQYSSRRSGYNWGRKSVYWSSARPSPHNIRNIFEWLRW